MQKFLLQPGYLPSLSAQLISQQVCFASLSSELQPTKQPPQPKSVFPPQPTWQPLMLSFSANHQKSILPPSEQQHAQNMFDKLPTSHNRVSHPLLPAQHRVLHQTFTAIKCPGALPNSSNTFTMNPIHKTLHQIHATTEPSSLRRATPRSHRKVAKPSTMGHAYLVVWRCRRFGTLTSPPMHRQPANLYKPHQRQQQLGSSPFLLHLHARALPLPSSVPCTSCHPSICSAAAGYNSSYYTWAISPSASTAHFTTQVHYSSPSRLTAHPCALAQSTTQSLLCLPCPKQPTDMHRRCST